MAVAFRELESCPSLGSAGSRSARPATRTGPLTVPSSAGTAIRRRSPSCPRTGRPRPCTPTTGPEHLSSRLRKARLPHPASPRADGTERSPRWKAADGTLLHRPDARRRGCAPGDTDIEVPRGIVTAVLEGAHVPCRTVRAREQNRSPVPVVADVEEALPDFGARERRPLNSRRRPQGLASRGAGSGGRVGRHSAPRPRARWGPLGTGRAPTAGRPQGRWPRSS